MSSHISDNFFSFYLFILIEQIPIHFLQVHLTLGGNGANSMTVNWVNAFLNSSNTVMYGTSMTSMTSSIVGKSAAYTQLLAPTNSYVYNPVLGGAGGMGKPGVDASVIINLANTSSFAYDADGTKWANYRKVSNIASAYSSTTKQLGYSNPYAYYDSPMIHTAVISNLVPGMTYYYVPGESCKTYSFTALAASGTASMYPFKAALVVS